MADNLLTKEERFFISIYYGYSLFGLSYLLKDIKNTLIITLLVPVFIWNICMYDNSIPFSNKNYLLFELVIFTLFFIVCLLFIRVFFYDIEFEIINIFLLLLITLLIWKMKTNEITIYTTSTFEQIWYKTIFVFYMYYFFSMLSLNYFNNRHFVDSGTYMLIIFSAGYFKILIDDFAFRNKLDEMNRLLFKLFISMLYFNFGLFILSFIFDNRKFIFSAILITIYYLLIYILYLLPSEVVQINQTCN